MNIVVSARFPFPLDKGDRLTVYHTLRCLSARHRMSLVCFLEPEQDASWVDKVAPFCQRIEFVPLNRSRAYLNCASGLLGALPLQVRYYTDPAMKAAIDRVVEEERPDVLYSQLLRVSAYIEPFPQCVRVAAFNLSVTLEMKRTMEHSREGFIRRQLARLEYRKLEAFEPEFARRFDRVLYISPHDRRTVEGDQRLDNVFINPHGVDHAHFTPDPSVEKEPFSLVMTGNMGYAPNIDAALYLQREVLPIVRREAPNVRLSIVGTDPSAEVRALADDPAITVTGRVPDLRSYMNRAMVAVAPIRIGAGLQNKVLEGMSMGLPVVTTSIGNEATEAVNGETIAIGDTPAEFASQIIDLLRDRERRERLGSAARAFILDKWTWETYLVRLEQEMEELVAEKRTASLDAA